MSKKSSIRRGIIALILGCVALLVPIILQGSSAPGSSAQQPASANCAVTATSSIHYYALDSGKQVPYAFGTPIVYDTTQSFADQEKVILPQLDTSLSSDPLFAATNYALVGKISQDTSVIQSTAAEFVQNRALWCTAVNTIESYENASTAVGLVTAPADSASFYMVPNQAGDGLILHNGFTSQAGAAIVFKTQGMTIELRLPCHFQPILPPGHTWSHVPTCNTVNCSPPPPCTYGQEWNVQYQMMLCKKSGVQNVGAPPYTPYHGNDAPQYTPPAAKPTNGATNGAPGSDTGSGVTVGGATPGTPSGGASVDPNGGTPAAPAPGPIAAPTD
jgi:hypothetical protein